MSASENVLEDVLPSFEMHNYMFNRTIYDTENITLSDLPPNYDDNINQNINDKPIDLNNFVDPTKNPNLILLNNLEKFQRIDLSPLNIQIVLTKNIPKLNIKSERENPLREYKPSEIVCGYITIENKSNDPIPFEMLLVSLEGQSTIPHPSNSDDLIKKKILTTYDLSACFHYGCIDLESQGVTSNVFSDDTDNSLIGFSSDRIIQPKTKHKKFFAFKLPKYLLDNSCFDQLVDHLQLPPSFGVNNHAFKCAAKNIKIDPFLGYGRLDRYGSPIKTYDYALDGQSISYFINVQFIGRNLNCYKKFYTLETKHEYDFIFLKNVEYYFRVDTSNIINDSTYNEISTNKQLNIIENLITDKLHETVERKNLLQIGIDDLRKQDEIIFSSQSNSKKLKQLSSTELVPVSSDFKTAISDIDSFNRTKNVKIVKDFFSKVDGDLSIRLTMHRNAQIKSLKPKKLGVSLSSPSLTQLNNVSNTNNVNELKPVFSSPDIVQRKKLLSRTSSSTTLKSYSLAASKSIDSHLQNLDLNNSNTETIYVNLTFKSSEKSNKKVSLPSSISITPNLKIYNIMSPYPIPITFDPKFIFEGGLESGNISKIKKKFSFYYQQLLENLKQLDSGLARSLYNKINGLSRLFVNESTLKKIFETHVVDLSNQWKYNENLQLYECEFKLPLVYDFKNNYEKISIQSLPPTFQQCHLSRLYSVDIDIGVKKSVSKSKMSMMFPVTIN